MIRTFYPGFFGFMDRDEGIAGVPTASPPSLSGVVQMIRGDGGGSVTWSYGNATLYSREQILAWRALVAGMDGGATPMVVVKCDKRFQPVGSGSLVPHSDLTPFDDTSLYVSSSAIASASAAAALRATTMSITIVSVLPLGLGGEWFSIEHPTWGWRAYQVIRIDGNLIEFRPPLREAVPSGTPLDFDSPRCLMRVDGVPGAPTQFGGKTGTAAIKFVEWMGKPEGS